MNIQYLLALFVTLSSLKPAASKCDVVPITQWGGSPSSRHQELKKPVKLVIVQHTVSPECFSDDDCGNAAQRLRHFQLTQGFDDIGISFLVGGNGKIYEGAGWKIGAHSIGFNDRSISISFMGDYRDKLPTDQALQAAQEFLSCSVENKNLSDSYYLVGHMQLSQTLSPGAALQREIETWPHWVKMFANFEN